MDISNQHNKWIIIYEISRCGCNFSVVLYSRAILHATRMSQWKESIIQNRCVFQTSGCLIYENNTMWLFRIREIRHYSTVRDAFPFSRLAPWCGRRSCKLLLGGGSDKFDKNTGAFKIWNASRFCVSSLRRGYANLLCIVPILVFVLPKLARTRSENPDSDMTTIIKAMYINGETTVSTPYTSDNALKLHTVFSADMIISDHVGVAKIKCSFPYACFIMSRYGSIAAYIIHTLEEFIVVRQ